jgi:hypothetical protein
VANFLGDAPFVSFVSLLSGTDGFILADNMIPLTRAGGARIRITFVRTIEIMVSCCGMDRILELYQIKLGSVYLLE